MALTIVSYVEGARRIELFDASGVAIPGDFGIIEEGDDGSTSLSLINGATSFRYLDVPTE